MKTISDSQDNAIQGASLIPEKQKERGLWRTFAALRHRNFRLFWFGQLLSLIGTWMQSIGQAWLVLELTHSSLLLGVVGAFQFLPILLFTLFGGVLADSWARRTVLLFTQSSAMIEALLLWILVLTGIVQIWHILVLATMLGITLSIDMPTRQAFIVEMVGRQDLPNAIALNSLLFNTTSIIGPGIGGLIIAALGVVPLFLLNGLSFTAVLIGLALVDRTKLHRDDQHLVSQWKEPKQGPIESLRDGLAYVFQTPCVLLIIAVSAVISLFSNNSNVILPLFATAVLHAGAAGFGFISAAFGLGALLSALRLAWKNKKPGVRSMLFGGTVFCITEAAFAISHIYMLSVVLIAAAGFAQITFTANANTTLQTVSPDRLRGRVMSVYMMVSVGSIPVGNLFIGGLANWLGASTALLLCAILSLIGVIGGRIYRKPAEKSLAETMEHKLV